SQSRGLPTACQVRGCLSKLGQHDREVFRKRRGEAVLTPAESHALLLLLEQDQNTCHPRLFVRLGSTPHPSLGTRDQQDLLRQLAIELGQRCFRKTSAL